MKSKGNIYFKTKCLDPQGQAVANSLIGQGFNNIKNVRQGKILDIEFNSNEVDINMINEMCESFLTNPLVEDYAIEEIYVTMKIGVVVFPGSNCDNDLFRAFEKQNCMKLFFYGIKIQTYLKI